MNRIIGWIATFPWQYGTCRDADSRRHRITGKVQFYYTPSSGDSRWMEFDPYWWDEFISH